MSGGYSPSHRRAYGGGGYSSGGPSSPQPSEQKKLEDFAKRSIKQKLSEVQSRPKKRVFISYRFEDKDGVQALRSQAKNKDSELEFTDMGLKTPFDSKNAEYIKGGIRKRISSSSATVVFLGKNTHKSNWVNWEIEETVRQGKRVVIVNATGSNSPQLPPAAVNNSKVKVVPWKHKEIMNAINESAENR